MSKDRARGTPGEKVKAELILLAPQYRLRGVRTAGPVANDRRRSENLSLEDRVAALAAEINRRWGRAD